MKLNRILLTLTGLVTAGLSVSAQSYFDDDIYYDASKDKAKSTVKTAVQTYRTPSTVVVAEYPAADTYKVNGTRTISVDDYNRRGIFATDSLTSDTTATDFAYTRRIEQFYNPEIVTGSGDQELATIYYMEPERVNIYINTPSTYWGYDYFYPDFFWYGPNWSFNWRWTSPWYWSSWYDPYWSWGPGWGWGSAWGPAWGWRPTWGWGPAWGWGGPVWGGHRPSHNPGVRPGMSANHRPSGAIGTSGRPGLINNGRPATNSYNRPGVTNNGVSGRPGVNSGTRQPTRGESTTTRPSNNTNNYNRPTNTNGGRTSGYGTFNQSSGSRGSSSFGSGGSFGGGRSSGGARTGGGGRGRH